MKKILCLILCLVMTAGILTGCKDKDEDLSIEKILEDTSMVIGTVDGQNIYAYEMIYYLRSGGVPDIEEIKDVIVETKVLQNLAKELGVEFGEEEQARIDDFIVQLEENYGSKEKLNEELKTIGITRDQYLAILKEAVMSEAVVAKIVDDGIIKTPDDTEIRAYFDANFLKAKHILFTTVAEDGATPLPEEETAAKTALANETMASIKGGAPFEQFENLNEDPGSASMPEGYVFVNTNTLTDENMLYTLQNAGVGVMVPEFTAGAAALAVDAVSDLVQTNYGYHIIKRLALTDQDFEDHKNIVSSILSQDIFNKYLQENVDKAAVSWKDNLVTQLKNNIKPIQPEETTPQQ